MKLENKKILIISPHLDDGVIGCGGLVEYAKQNNCEVFHLCMCIGKSRQLVTRGTTVSIQEKEMDLVAGTHGRGIYKMNIRPIQKAFEKGTPQTSILFETAVARRPWINDTHREPKFSTLERVPVTFYLMKEAEVEIRVNDEKGKTVWSKTLMGKQGFEEKKAQMDTLPKRKDEWIME